MRPFGTEASALDWARRIAQGPVTVLQTDVFDFVDHELRETWELQFLGGRCVLAGLHSEERIDYV